MKAISLSQTINRFTLLVSMHIKENLTESYMFSTYYNIAATPLSHNIILSYNKNISVYRKSSVCEIIKCAVLCQNYTT